MLQFTVILCRSLEGERDVTFHEHLHSQPLTCIAANHEGDILVTGEWHMLLCSGLPNVLCCMA